MRPASGERRPAGSAAAAAGGIDPAEATRTVESAIDAIVTGDPDGTVRMWNPGAVRLYGYTAAEMVGRSFMDLVPSRDLPRGQELHQHVLSGKPLPEFEAEARRKDGSLVEISLTLSPIVDGGRLTGIVAIARDIDARRRADFTRRQARQRFAGAFANAPIGMALVSREGRFVDVNPALCELLGRSREELSHLTFQELTHPDDLEADLSLLEDLVEGRIDRYELEKRYLRPDGRVVWGRLFVSLVEDADGRPHHFVSQIQDVTADKEQDLQLRQMAAHLEELSLSDPLTGVANVRAFDRAVSEEIAASRDSGEPFSVVLIDVDGLEELSRVEGGLEGDRILRSVAAALNGQAPGRVFRMASDDFAVVAPGVGYEGVGALAARLSRSAVVGAGGLAVSTGTATHPGEGDDPQEIVARASGSVRRGREGDSIGLGSFDRASSPRADVELAGVTALVAALEARDHYTAEHSRRVVDLAVAVARRLGLDEAAVQEVEQVAVLHDIGKVAVPDSVLQKPGPLSESEWVLMRQHPGVGERIVASLQTLSHLAAPIRAEHERFDGGGYPDGLAGEAIPIASRITLACDAFHAMTSTRPYRAAMSEEEARAELRRNAGAQFDPAVVDALLAELDASAPAVGSSGARSGR